MSRKQKQQPQTEPQAARRQEILDSESEILRRMKPVLWLRTAGSAVVALALWALHFRYDLFSPPMLVFVTILLFAVNYISFLFIKRGYPAAVFALSNGAFFIILIAISQHYTGGPYSPVVFGYVLLIFIIDTISGSLWVTLAASVLACIANDTVVLLNHYGVVMSPSFFIQLKLSFFGRDNPFAGMAILNVFFLFIGVLSGYLMGITGRVRVELEQANREKIRLQGLIRTLVSKNVWNEARTAAGGTDDMQLSERRETRTILFTDIVGFSRISENAPPEKLITMLNTHFQIMGEIIDRHDGDIDKFIGDAVMAVFDRPAQAMSAAVEIQRALKKAARDKRLPNIKVRIGINTGEVIIGSMGTAHRMDRTMIGDAVNTAQRLESMASPGGILVSESTFSLLDGGRYQFRNVGLVRLKGKRKRIRAYSYLWKNKTPSIGEEDA